MQFKRGGFPMRRMGVAVLAGLLAWLAAPQRSPAQVSQLVNFALYPESQIQLSVEGSGSDTRTQSNGEETLTQVEGASALAAWAPLPLALGVTQDDQHFLQESAGLELERTQRERGALAALNFGFLSLVALTSQRNLDVEAKDPLADIVLRLMLDSRTALQYGLLLDLGYVQAGYLRAQSELELKLALTAQSTLRESYHPERTTVIAGLRLQGKTGPFLHAYYQQEHAPGEKGTAVDFGGFTNTAISGSVGWMFSEESRVSLNASDSRSHIEFPGAIEFDDTAQEYGLSVAVKSGLTIGLSFGTQRHRFTLGLPAVGALSKVETKVDTARIGMGYRF